MFGGFAGFLRALTRQTAVERDWWSSARQREKEAVARENCERAARVTNDTADPYEPYEGYRRSMRPSRFFPDY
jgi:hypothetical protein